MARFLKMCEVGELGDVRELEGDVSGLSGRNVVIHSRFGFESLKHKVVLLMQCKNGPILVFYYTCTLKRVEKVHYYYTIILHVDFLELPN